MTVTKRLRKEKGGKILVPSGFNRRGGKSWTGKEELPLVYEQRGGGGEGEGGGNLFCIGGMSQKGLLRSDSLIC